MDEVWTTKSGHLCMAFISRSIPSGYEPTGKTVYVCYKCQSSVVQEVCATAAPCPDPDCDGYAHIDGREVRKLEEFENG